MDIRDTIYNFTNWEWTWQHFGQTFLDGIGLIPVIGVVNKLDEVSALIKAIGRFGAETSSTLLRSRLVLESYTVALNTLLFTALKKTLVAIETFLKHETLKSVPQKGESRGGNCGLHNFEPFPPFEKVLSR